MSRGVGRHHLAANNDVVFVLDSVTGILSYARVVKSACGKYMGIGDWGETQVGAKTTNEEEQA